MAQELKDPLQYSEQELRNLPVQELKQLLKDSEYKESLYNTRQLTEKVLINGLYGAMANRYFPLFNEGMAAAITGNGRYFIQKLAIYIEEALQKLIPSEKPYVVGGDTDSCVGSTIIRTTQGNIKIEDLYNILAGNIEIKSANNYVKHLSTKIKAASVNKSKELEFQNIKYIMKHKVKKRFFKIRCLGKEVTITEDHSLVVLRNNELISIKPKELLEKDKIIHL